MKFPRVTLVGCLVLGAAAAQAADSVELTITGEIVPAACVPTLSTANLDFGKIPVESLKKTTTTNLSGKLVTLILSCDGPAKVAFQTIDNRSGTAITGGTGVYGLDEASGKIKIGEYAILWTSVTGDGADRYLHGSVDKGSNWTSLSGGAEITTSSIYGIADTESATEPGAYSAQTFEFQVVVTIAPADSLPITSDITLDGSVTFEVVYL
ncbi:DUF1120 domain-containing protein [Pseudomonas sp. GZD-222]|uniref:DUF1120 domain-containing protein n=1 Tax=Pseudomonas sp. GZD-222 TaxID=3404805 RepID=UPI003BB7A649